MMHTGRILHCDRCGKQETQLARTVEEKCFNTQLITLPDWPDGWKIINNWHCYRKATTKPKKAHGNSLAARASEG